MSKTVRTSDYIMMDIAHQDEINRLRAINAELLAALQAIMVNFVGDRGYKNCYGEPGKAAEQARAAIAKCAKD